MKYKIKMSSKDDDGLESSVEDIFDDDDDYVPEMIASLGCRLLASMGFTHDTAQDIQTVGWARLTREKPHDPDQYLVAVPNGNFVKSTCDQWDGEKFVQYGNKVIFLAMFPSSPAFWSNGG